MSDHTRALVPLETWAYASPELRAVGRSVDIGLLAEALLYYDQVLVNFASQPHLAEVIAWLDRQRGWFGWHKGLRAFTSLIREGTIRFYDYSFVAVPVRLADTGVYDAVNVQDPIQAQPDTFEQRYLRHPTVVAAMPSQRRQNALVQAARGHVIEVKADEFGVAAANAKADLLDPVRSALIVQRLVDELYSLRSIPNPPEITASITAEAGERRRITFNVDFTALSTLAGAELNIHPGSPLAAAITTTKLAWSTAKLECDLYLPSPISGLVADKLDESLKSASKPQVVLENLKDIVEFPDVRSLVNAGHLSLADVLSIRRKASRFRRWLQTEGDRDRDAIIAYHHEVARQAGLERATRKTISLVSTVGSGAVGAAVGTVVGAAYADPVASVVGGAAASAVGLLGGLASRLNAGWRPVVFGRWLEDRLREKRA